MDVFAIPIVLKMEIFVPNTDASIHSAAPVYIMTQCILMNHTDLLGCL